MAKKATKSTRERFVAFCGNPKCNKIVEVEDKGMTPYLWFNLYAQVEGPGPDISVVACSEECVGPAIISGLDFERDKERQEYT